MDVEKRAKQIARELGVTYATALLLAMSEQDVPPGDVMVRDADGNESPAPLTPLEEGQGPRPGL